MLFRSIAGFNINITEDITGADIITIAAAFAASITEASTLADIESIANAFFLTITENLNSAEVASISHGIPVSITEAFVSGDLNATQWAFLESITENVILNDTQFPRGWIKINDAQTATWQLVQSNNYTYNTGMMFGGAAFCEVPFSTIYGVSAIVNQPWTPIKIGRAHV